MRSKFILFILFYLLISLNSFAEKKNSSPKLDSLIYFFHELSIAKSELKKENINDSLITYFKDFLSEEESFNLSYDSVKFLTVLKTDDNHLNIYTWNINYRDGRYKYFGFLQYKASDGIKLFFLDDKKYKEEENLKNRHFKSPAEWYGAIYYEVVTKKWNGITYYTLVGWDGADMFINRKTIEVLYFNKSNLPIFGAKVFKLENTHVGRMVFEYNETAVMMLRYNKVHDIIVLDHLSPSETKYEGMPEYYGPDKSFDALRFKYGKWILEKNIDPNIAINYKKNSNVHSLKRRKSQKTR